MKLITYIALLFLTSCATSQRRADTAESLYVVAKEIFDKENNISADRDILRLKREDHVHEWRLRDVERNDNIVKLMPPLEKLHQQYGNDADSLTLIIQEIVSRSGCSKALISALGREFGREFGEMDFDFVKFVHEDLNPDYRYSKTLLDERALYGPQARKAFSKWKAYSKRKTPPL